MGCIFQQKDAQKASHITAASQFMSFSGEWLEEVDSIRFDSILLKNTDMSRSKQGVKLLFFNLIYFLFDLPLDHVVHCTVLRATTV